MKVYIVLRHNVYPELADTEIVDVFGSTVDAEKCYRDLGGDKPSSSLGIEGDYYSVIEKEVK